MFNIVRRMDEHSENFNEEIKIQKSTKWESQKIKNRKTQLGNTLVGLNRGLNEAEERISDLKDKTMEVIQKDDLKKI